jgi:hypothetical protein
MHLREQQLEQELKQVGEDDAIEKKKL